MIVQLHDLELFADYYQFYLQDESVEGNLEDSWNQEATNRLLALAPGTIGIGTARDNHVPVKIEIHDADPIEELSEWNQVIECDIDLPSGRLVVAGCTDYFPDAARIIVDPGHYRARVFYNQSTQKENYKVSLWRGNPIGIQIRKQLKIS